MAYRDGQAASALPTLIFYRDLLTELYIRSRASQWDRLRAILLPWTWEPMQRLPSIMLPQMGAARTSSTKGLNGLTGFGVYHGEDGLELAMFAENRTKMVEKLYYTLRESGLPVTLHPSVCFVAAGSRPVQGGDSVGHGVASGASGTMGCVVKDRSGNELFALTCNHVIADLNNAKKGTTKVWAPGAKKHGTANDELGVVHDFADIDFTPGAYNVIDAAIAKPNNVGDIDKNIQQIGTPSGTNFSINFGDAVKKSGVESGLTDGKYRYQINAEIEYDNGQKTLFRDLIGIVGLAANKFFGKKGDSGAVILDENDAVVGQLISVANGMDLTLATAIKPVLDQFKVDIA